MINRTGYWLLTGLTLALYLVMVVWTLPAIQAAAAGLRPFDLRPMGYSADEAQRFLNALSDEGRAMYAGTQHRLDFAFPGLLAVWSIWTLVKLLPRWLALGFGLVALIGAGADYAENARVAALLTGFDPQTAMAASHMSVLKSVCATLVYSVILAGLLRLAWRRFRR